MPLLHTRELLSGIRNVSKVAFDAKGIVQKTKVKEEQLDEISKNLSKKSPSAKRKVIGKLNRVPEWYEFNTVLNFKYDEPTISEINTFNHFFNSADIKFEWSVAKFMEIPGEKLKEKYESPTGVTRTSSISTKKFPGKTYVPFELVNGLPEVAFLGKSNAGKSTLLNNLSTDLKNNSLNIFAKASKRAGFTKTLNSFNIGNRIRLIDTPGYGYKSSLEQGALTTEYLLKRRELLRSFLLISGEQGVSDLDIQLIEFMHKNGVAFEIVFTKMDKVADVNEFEKSIRESGIMDLPTLPRLIFTNSVTSKICAKRYGIDLLRSVILQSCGLQAGLKPLRKRQK